MKDTFIDKDKNDYFSYLRGIDLQELLLETENYLLEYRDGLGLPGDITFGTEIEYEGVFKYGVDCYVKKNLSNWHSDMDCSLSTVGEITSPIMKDNSKYWNELENICKYLSDAGADTSHRAGGHVHIGTQALGCDVEAWRQFLKLYAMYESVIFRFGYGDKVNGRERQLRYASPIADHLYKNLDNINTAKSLATMRDILIFMKDSKNYPIPKYTAINFYNVDYNYPDEQYEKNTIEFRSPNATTNAIIWQNNINAFTKMLLSARNKNIDEDFLDYKLAHDFVPFRENRYEYNEFWQMNVPIPGNEYTYNVINLKSVLEFVDLVFDNNLDKVYFLRQYLKDFQDGYNLKAATKAKKFTR